VGLIPDSVIDIIIMIPDASLLSTRHIKDRSGYSLLLNLVKNGMSSIWNEQLSVINISLNNLFRI